MKKVKGGWRIDHDHVTYWRPKEDWLRERVGPEGNDWKSIEPIFPNEYVSHQLPIRPLHWIIKDKHKALVFALIWEHK